MVWYVWKGLGLEVDRLKGFGRSWAVKCVTCVDCFRVV